MTPGRTAAERVKPSHRWTPQDHGLPGHATYRCLRSLPEGGLAAGTDYGLVLWRNDRWTPFPFPRGARQQSRHVESIAVQDSNLFVATRKNWYAWPFEGEAQGRSFRRDAYGVVIELRALHAGPTGLLQGWQDGLVGGEGPPDCICFATAQQALFAGTLDGRLHRIDQGELRRFELDGRPAPVRHLAWAHHRLWVASAGALHTWDGQSWRSRPGEPYGMHSDRAGRLWTLREGRLHLSEDGDWPHPVSLPLDRPWALASTGEGDLWIGCVGALVRVPVP